MGLSREGIRFYIVSFEKKERFKIYKKNIDEICKQNNITWIPLSYTKKPPVLSTILDIFKLNNKVKNILKTENIDIIHCRSYITSLIGLRYKMRMNIPFIFDMRGFWADERVDGNIWNLKNPMYLYVYKYFKQKEKQLLKLSDAIIVLTEAAKKEITYNICNEVSSDKITVIPCSVDFQKFKRISNEEVDLLKTKLNISNDTIVIGYLGSLGTWYMIDEMLHFYSIFLQKYPRSVFLFITQDNLSSVISKSKLYGIPYKNIIKVSVPNNEVHKYLSLCNASIFFIKPSYSKMASSATKFAELIALKIPIICNAIGDLKEHVSQITNTFCVSEFSEKAYNEAINKIAIEHKAETSENLLSLYNLETAITNYLKIYKCFIIND